MPAPRLGQGPTIDLLNTVWADRAGVHDELGTASDSLRGLRDALRVLAADRTSDPRPVAAGHDDRVADAVATLNAAAALAPGWPTLVDGSLVWASDAGGEAREVGLLAGEAVRFLASGPELRACLAPGCVLYFVKDHPRRAWCSTGCGNRERAARHYARQRASRQG
jgi:predicted RNA-binding Zn ribbon-like protein